MTNASFLRTTVSAFALMSMTIAGSALAQTSQPTIELNLDVLQRLSSSPVAAPAVATPPREEKVQAPVAEEAPEAPAVETAPAPTAVTSDGQKMIWVKGPEGKPLTPEQERALRKRPSEQPGYAKPKPKPAKKAEPKKEPVKEAIKEEVKKVEDVKPVEPPKAPKPKAEEAKAPEIKKPEAAVTPPPPPPPPVMATPAEEPKAATPPPPPAPPAPPVEEPKKPVVETPPPPAASEPKPAAAVPPPPPPPAPKVEESKPAGQIQAKPATDTSAQKPALTAPAATTDSLPIITAQEVINQPAAPAKLPEPTLALPKPPAPPAPPALPEVKTPSALPSPPNQSEPLIAEPPASEEPAQKEPALPVPPPPAPPAPPPAKPDADSVKPAEKAMEQAITAPAGKADLSVVFKSTETSVPLSMKAQLDGLAESIKASAGSRINLVAYASGTEDQASTARRVSLSRALAVRAYLIEKGVDKLAINVQAEGNKNPGGEADRVDVFVVRGG